MNRLPASARVRLDRIMSDWETLAAIGSTGNGGVTRLAYSEEDRKARSWIVERMRNAGLGIEVDVVGNIFGWPEPIKGRPVVLTGSHLDTVRDGGNCDGVLGSICALEVTRVLQEHQHQGAHPTGMVVFASEESTRFGVAAIGSGVMMGLLSAQDLLAPELVDSSGITLLEAMRNCGLDATRAGEAERPPGWVRSFIELHIEQGSRLKSSGCQVGVVTNVAAHSRYRFVVLGETGHSGAALMGARRDALVAASEMVLAVEAVAKAYASQHVVATVGVMRVWPGSMNTVPSRVEMGLDLRGLNPDPRERAIHEILEAIGAISRARDVQVETFPMVAYTPLRVSDHMLGCIERACTDLGASWTRVLSHAGHDAVRVARYADAGMLFIPNQTGVSHRPEERATPADVEVGANVLLHSLARLAEEGARVPPPACRHHR